MASFTAGTTFTDGVANDVTAAKLAALVNAATPTSGLIQDRTAETTIAADDTLLFGDFSDSSNLKRMTVANFAGTLPTATITSGTITTLNSTTGTITTGVIPTLTSTTLITTGTGTAASPAIVPTGDTNTGLFFPAADTIAFSEGGAEAMRIDSSGNVGIGTVSPASKLHVVGASGLTLSGTDSAVRIARLDSAIEGSNGARFLINVANDSGTLTERLRIDSSGNVGVGTASPTAKFHVASTSCDVIIQDSDTARASNPAALLSFWGSDARAGYIGYPSDSNMYINQANSGAILFLTNSTERLRIDASGNVGIGSTAPNARLFASVGTSPNLAQIVIGYLNGSDNYYDANTHYFRDGSSTDTMLINSSGVTIATLAGSGSRTVNASAAGLLSAASDASLKEEVVGAHIAGLAEILQIHPKMYRWKDDIANRGDEASVELGFIANDVAPIIPSAAPMGNDGLYGFYDRSVIAALVKAIQELSAKVTALEAA